MHWRRRRRPVSAGDAHRMMALAPVIAAEGVSTSCCRIARASSPTVRRGRRRALWAWRATRGSALAARRLPAIVRVNVRGLSAGIWPSPRFFALTEALTAPGGPCREARRCCSSVLRLYMASRAPAASDGWQGWGSRVGALNALRASGARLDAGGSRPCCEHVAVGSRRALSASGGSPPMQYLTQWRMLLAANLTIAKQCAAGAHRQEGQRNRHGVQRASTRATVHRRGLAPWPVVASAPVRPLTERAAADAHRGQVDARDHRSQAVLDNRDAAQPVS